MTLRQLPAETLALLRHWRLSVAVASAVVALVGSGLREVWAWGTSGEAVALTGLHSFLTGLGTHLFDQAATILLAAALWIGPMLWLGILALGLFAGAAAAVLGAVVLGMAWIMGSLALLFGWVAGWAWLAGLAPVALAVPIWLIALLPLLAFTGTTLRYDIRLL